MFCHCRCCVEICISDCPSEIVSTVVLTYAVIIIIFVLSALKSASETLNDHLPNDADVTSAMLSLVRLQKTYDLPISDLVQGNVAGYQAPPLDNPVVFQLALLCLGNGEPDEALRWLTYVHDVTTGKVTTHYEDDDKTPLPAIYQAFGRAYAQVGYC